MKNELEEIKRTMQDVSFALSKLITNSDIYIQKSMLDLTMETRKSIVRLSAIINSMKEKAGEN